MIRNRLPRRPAPILLTLLATAALVPAGAACAAAPLAAFVCAAAQRSTGGERPAQVPGVAVADQFSTGNVTVKPASRLCAPVSLDGTPPGDAAIQLLRH